MFCMFVDKKGYFKYEFFCHGFQSVKQGILYSNIEYKIRKRWVNFIDPSWQIFNLLNSVFCLVCMKVQLFYGM